jgi:hypothetical protein
MYTPTTSATGEIFGMCSLVFTWDDMFRNILPDNYQRVYLVLKTKTSVFTLAVDGAQVIVLGKGDLHDMQYDSYGIRIADDSLLSAGGYSFTVFPSQDLYNRFITANPANACALVVGLSFLSALLVLVYSYLLQKRQTAMVYVAARDAALESKKQFVRYC